MIVNQRNALLTALLAVFAASTTARAQNSEIQTNNTSREVAVDGSTKWTFHKSLERVRKGLPSKERWQVDLVLEYAAATLPPEEVRGTFDGKTGQDLQAMAAMLIEQYDLSGDGDLDERERDELRSDLADARIQRHETATLASLKHLHTAQTTVQTEQLIDVDGDGLGEFAYLAEMTGADTRRCKPRKPKKKEDGEEEEEQGPLLPASWKVVDGRVVSEGYVYQMWLPDLDLLAVPEGEAGGVGQRPPGPKTSVLFWVVVCWPQENEVSGRRAFCITQQGTVFETDNLFQRYSGTDKAPEPFAAFERGTGKFDAELKEVKAYNDGGQWKQVR